MEEQGSAQRSLPASERKIRRAREEGQVARSRDLVHFAVIGTALALAAVAAPSTFAWMQRVLAQALRFDRRALDAPEVMLQRLAALGLELGLVALALGALLAAVAALASVLAGGWNFSAKAARPQFKRLHPLQGLRRMVSAEQLVQTLKASALALVLGAIAAAYLGARLPSFAHAAALPLPSALAQAAGVTGAGLALLLLALAACAAIDVPLQRHRLLQRLKMTHQEARQEHKELEGNQEVKGKRRVLMREFARRRMLSAVPKADLVVMNPSHYAVALRYDERSMAAPRVVAKGADLLALRIRDTAREHRVPVLQAPPLARALYAHAEVDAEIPATLFAAVAQVLAWVYQLRAAMAAGRTAPEAPQVELPAGLDPLA